MSSNSIWHELSLSAANRPKVDSQWTEQLRDVRQQSSAEEAEVNSQVAMIRSERREAQLTDIKSRLDTHNSQVDRAERAFSAVMDRASRALQSGLARLQHEAEADEAALETEWAAEIDEIRASHAADMEYQRAILRTVKLQRAQKLAILQDENRAMADDIRNHADEATNLTSVNLQTTISALENALSAAHSNYIQSTAGASKQLRLLAAKDKHDSATVAAQDAEIQRLKKALTNWRDRLASASQDFARRNAGLLKEHEAALAHFSALRSETDTVLEADRKAALLLSKSSSAAIKKLEEQCKLADDILRAHKLCQRLETVEEQVWPFGRNENQVESENGVMTRFYRRTNNALLDLACLENNFRALEADNQSLRNAVTAYLDAA